MDTKAGVAIGIGIAAAGIGAAVILSKKAEEGVEKGTLNVTSSPSGATVKVNGTIMGTAPLSVDLNPGNYSIDISLSGYQNYTASATIAAGQTTPVQVTLIPVSVTLSSITISPSAPGNLQVGFTQQFTAVGHYSDGSTSNLSLQVAWASSNTGIAAISSNGTAIGIAAGTTQITASMSGKTSSAVSLTVVAPPVSGYACPYCTEVFDTLQELIDHIITEHPGQIGNIIINW